MSPKRRGFRVFLYAFTLTLIILIVDALVLEPYAVFYSITRLSISDSRIPEGSVIRIVQLSDLHIHGYGFREEHVLNAVESLKPDILVLTGDYIESSRDLPFFEKFLVELHQRVGDKPVIAILGNWDYWSLVPDIVSSLIRRIGGIVLIDNYTIVSIRGVRIVFVGLKSSTGTGSEPDYQVLSEINYNLPVILLAHEPLTGYRAVEEVGGGKLALVLAGHCHGGQVKALFYPLFLPEGCGRYYEGEYSLNGTIMYVSRGIGTTLLPIRFMSWPEIVVIDLHSSKK